MSAPRGLTAEEADAWERVAATVKRLHPYSSGTANQAKQGGRAQPDIKTAAVGEGGPEPGPKAPSRPSQPGAPLPLAAARHSSPPGSGQDRSGLDGHWDRRLKSGSIQPDLTLDLHDHGLDAAYDRLMSGIAQARAMGARIVLLITGRPRPVAPADRAERRGAIRAKVLDWLAASSHHSAIAAVRRAHQRHGGDGALYIVLRRER